MGILAELYLKKGINVLYQFGLVLFLLLLGVQFIVFSFMQFDGNPMPITESKQFFQAACFLFTIQNISNPTLVIYLARFRDSLDVAGIYPFAFVS